jgi:hypothetical protein
MLVDKQLKYMFLVLIKLLRMFIVLLVISAHHVVVGVDHVVTSAHHVTLSLCGWYYPYPYIAL